MKSYGNLALKEEFIEDFKNIQSKEIVFKVIAPDAQNHRIGKKVNGVLVKGWLYGDGLLPIAELNADGSVASRFVGGVMYKNDKEYKIITNHIGSSRLIVDSETGEIAQQIDYDEFGQITNDTNPDFQPFGFAGGLYDPDTKLVRFGARDYDPETGRWTTKDPIDFAGGDTNLYGYCLNDPVNFRDENGLWYLDFNYIGSAGTGGIQIGPSGLFGYAGIGA